jgi:hypothetical protein
MSTAVDDDIASTFKAALAQDAGIPAPAAEATAPAPPRKPDPAEQAEQPRAKPRPAKPKPDDKPRVAPAEEAAPLDASKYAAGLQSFGEGAWLVLSLNPGLKVGPVGLPDTRPYAALFKNNLPALASSWGEAARQNASVRKVVSKVAGDGGGSWMLGVAFSSAMFAMGCANLARAENAELRAQLAAANDVAVQEYLQNLAKSLGIEREAA